MDRHRIPSRDRSADHHHHGNHCYRRSRERTDHYDNGNHAAGALRQRRNKRSRSPRRSRSREKRRSREKSDFLPKYSSQSNPPRRMESSKEHSRSVSSERDRNSNATHSLFNGKRKRHFPSPMYPIVMFHVSFEMEVNNAGDRKQIAKDTIKECIPGVKIVAFPFRDQLIAHVGFESVTDIPLSFMSTRVHAFDYFRLEHFGIHEFNQVSKHVVSPYGFESLLSHFQQLDVSKLRKYCLNDLVGCCNMVPCKYVHLETRLEKDHIRRRIMGVDCPNGIGCTRYICHFKHPVTISAIDLMQEDSTKQPTPHPTSHDLERVRLNEFKPFSSSSSKVTNENLAPKYVVDAVYSFISGRKESIVKQDDLKELCSILPQAIPFVQHSFTEFFDSNKDIFKLFTDPKTSQLLIQALPRKRNHSSNNLAPVVISAASSLYIDNDADYMFDADWQSEEKKQNEKAYSFSSTTATSRSLIGMKAFSTPFDADGNFKPKLSTSNKEHQIRDEVDALLTGYTSFDSSWNPRCVSINRPSATSSAIDNPELPSSYISIKNEISKSNSDTSFGTQYNIDNQNHSDNLNHVSVWESKMMDVEHITIKEPDIQKPIQYVDCLLCKRRFKSQEALRYHEEYSDLHFQNIQLQQNQAAALNL